ncbi:uncharacterized protein BDZ83DRAFT_414201 [Colletotrichum acutatum]|uniref:Uncharacterized protein n=1 Tax=Glomerella acutata TaxID=27357 RepID=A0AAD8XCK0_GLOAC|nr:uncharacterized protein BDZ83DRAFT_414201 [Colletotrichum acutatum]KAK1722729.1 hypothetical protein BDZ83DRAFT_414201 [Colletotrichum acutatum]
MLSPIRVEPDRWPSGPKPQEAGNLFQIAFDESLSGFGMYLYTQVLGLTREAVDALISEMRKESRKKSNCHSYEVQLYTEKSHKPTRPHVGLRVDRDCVWCVTHIFRGLESGQNPRIRAWDREPPLRPMFGVVPREGLRTGFPGGKGILKLA